MHLAANNNQREVVRILVNKGADLNVKTNLGCSPLFIAAAVGNVDIVAYLIERGAIVDTPGIEGMSPLHVALRNGQRHIVPMILPFCSVTTPDETKMTPLHHASCQGYDEIVKSLVKSKTVLDVRGPQGCTPLFFAAHNGHDEVVRYLLEQGASIQLSMENGATPLHVAAAHNYLNSVYHLITDSFFAPQYEPALHELKTLKEKSFIKTLVELEDYQALKNNLVKLEPWSADLIAAHVPLNHQQKLVQAWTEQLKKVRAEMEDVERDINAHQLARLRAAHYKRHFNKIKDVIALCITTGETARDIAQQKNHHDIVQLLDHMVQAADFSNLSDDIRTSIMENISKKLGFCA